MQVLNVYMIFCKLSQILLHNSIQTRKKCLYLSAQDQYNKFDDKQKRYEDWTTEAIIHPSSLKRRRAASYNQEDGTNYD